MPNVPPLFAFSTNRYHRAKRSIPGKLSKGATPLLEAKWNSHNFASQLPDCQSAVMPSRSYGQNYIIKNLEMILCQFYAGLCVCSLQLRTVVPPYSRPARIAELPRSKFDPELFPHSRGPKSLNFPDGNFQRAKTFRTKCVNCFREKNA